MAETDPSGQAPADAAPGTPAATPSMVWLVLLLPGGFAYGIVAGFVQEQRLTIGEWSLPIMAFVALAGLIASIRALSLYFGTRTAGWLFFIGWLIACALMALPNPSGDVIFTAELVPVVYLLGGALFGSATASWPLRLRGPASASERVAPAAFGAGT